MKIFSTFTGIGGFEIGIQNAYRSTHRRIQANTQANDETGEGLFTSQRQDVSTKKRQLGTSFANKPNQRPLFIGYSEVDKYATSVYERHFEGVKNYGDITKIKPEELPKFDCLVGGFPCQAFSIAGKRGGFEDTRGTLFFDLARILLARKPRLFCFENVKGLLSHDNGQTFKIIIKTLTEMGYDCQWQVLNSKHFGVPQNRERVIIVGHLRGTARPKVFPFYRESRTIDKALFIDESQYRREGKLREYQGISPTLNTVGGGGHLPLTDKPIIRKLTPLECERLQGFPDNWTKYGKDGETISDTQRYKMCGNAVTTNVIQAVFERIFV